MKIAIIVLIILGIVFIGVSLIGKGVNSDKWWLSVLGFFLVILSPLSGMMVDYYMNDNPTPQAIDVYRGNTILKITYRDSVPVDSVVIFKNKRYESKN